MEIDFEKILKAASESQGAESKGQVVGLQVVENQFTGNIEDGGIAVQKNYYGVQPVEKTDKTVNAEPVEIPLFRYISPFVTDEKERVHLHKVVVNLVTSGYGMSYICSELIKLDKADKLALNTTVENQYNELVRLGLPKDEKGYSLRNYENYMSAAKEK